MTGFSIADRAHPGPGAGLTWAAPGLVLVALVLAAEIWWALPRLYPEVPLAGGQPLEMTGATFSAPIGMDAARERETIRVRALRRGQAMFVRRVSFQAAEAPLLRLAQELALRPLYAWDAWMN